MRKKHYIALSFIAVLALVIAITMCGIALDHNPSGEFYECSEGPGIRNCSIQWNALIWLGGSWFIAVVMIGGMFYGSILLMQAFVKKHFLRK